MITVKFTNKETGKETYPVFARTEKEFINTLFKSVNGRTASGYYKENKDSYTLYDMAHKKLINIKKDADRVFKLKDY